LSCILNESLEYVLEVRKTSLVNDTLSKRNFTRAAALLAVFIGSFETPSLPAVPASLIDDAIAFAKRTLCCSSYQLSGQLATALTYGAPLNDIRRCALAITGATSLFLTPSAHAGTTGAYWIADRGQNLVNRYR
jgi:hypothetical protein